MNAYFVTFLATVLLSVSVAAASEEDSDWGAGWTIKSCSNSQASDVNRAATEAFRCIERGKILIDRYWEPLKKLHNWTGTPKSYFQVLFAGNNRSFYQNVYQKALAAKAKNSVPFQCTNSCPEDRIAYTVFYFGRWPVAPIYFCPNFFKGSSDWTIVAHELGRLYGSISGDTDMNKENVYVWDQIVSVLCRDYDTLVGGK